MTAKEFELKYLNKIVRPRNLRFTLPDKEYIVTAALYNFEPKDITIFAIKALDYTTENKHSFTIRIAENDLHESMSDFIIL